MATANIDGKIERSKIVRFEDSPIGDLGYVAHGLAKQRFHFRVLRVVAPYRHTIPAFECRPPFAHASFIICPTLIVIMAELSLQNGSHTAWYVGPQCFRE